MKPLFLVKTSNREAVNKLFDSALRIATKTTEFPCHITLEEVEVDNSYEWILYLRPTPSEFFKDYATYLDYFRTHLPKINTYFG